MTPEERKEWQEKQLAAAKALGKYMPGEKMRIDKLPGYLQERGLELLAISVEPVEEGGMEMRALVRKNGTRRKNGAGIN